MAKRVRVSKGFIAAGFAPVDTRRRAAFAAYAACAGSALAIFRLTLDHFTMGEALRLPLLRLRIGSRKTILEMRAHTAKRATKGRWARVAEFSTPGNARDWTRLGKRIVAQVREGLPTATRGGWVWRDLPGMNETHTATNFNAKHPTLDGGNGRGKVGRSHPNQVLSWGWAPARGSRIATRKSS